METVKNVPAETFQFPGATLIDPTITPATEVVGALTDVTIQFILGSTLPASLGYIEL